MLLAGPTVGRSASPREGTLVAPPAEHTFGFRRVTSRELFLVLPGVRIVSPGGIAVARLAATDDPDSPKDDDEVTIVAVDTGGGRVVTHFGLLRAGTWGSEAEGLGTLERPADVALDRAGRVAVTDTGHGRVVLLHHDGESLAPVREFRGFLEPRGIAADGTGGFYVCDRGAGAVFHLDTATGARTTFGLEVAFERPIAIATVPLEDRLAAGVRRAVVVVDRDGRRLRSFGVTGALRGSVEAAALKVPDAAFSAVGIDYYGNIYAADREGDRLHKFRADLYPLDTFGRRGKNAGEFLSPRGIAIHRKFGQVFVSEESGGQYLWVGTDVRDFVARDEGDGVVFSFVLTEDSFVDLLILDTQGHEVAAVLVDSRQPAGPQRGRWDGTDAHGAGVAAGDYLVEIRARATYASRSTFEKKVLKAISLGRAEETP